MPALMGSLCNFISCLDKVGKIGTSCSFQQVKQADSQMMTHKVYAIKNAQGLRWVGTYLTLANKHAQT